MQLNAFTDFSLRVLIYAAARPDRRCTSDEVARAFGISRHHLVKVVNELQHLGYLETVRGRTGGFRLALPSERIHLGDVVRRTEATLALVECFDANTTSCPLSRGCGLQRVLGEAFDAFFGVLDRSSLADLVERPQWRARVLTLAKAAAGS